MGKKLNIRSLDHAGLREIATRYGQKPFRGDQLVHWLYGRGARDFAEMVNLPGDFRAKLDRDFEVAYPTLVKRQVAADKTRKYLVQLADGTLVETVAIPERRRLTVCLSTQVGCAMGCVFCATGQMGLMRSLAAGEMLDQLMMVRQDFADATGGDAVDRLPVAPAAVAVAASTSPLRISNVVAMGQGEPFANYDATLAALRMINDPALYGIGARHITVSTCGLLRPLERFATEPEQFTLAISLHSAVQATRDALMPELSHQPLAQLREALIYYLQNTSRRPSLEYVLIAGVNDNAAELAALLDFCAVPAPGFHVNLIRLNPLPALASGASQPLTSAAPAAMRTFQKALAQANVSASVRTPRGADILGACGQLASQGA
ncbi:MAG: 23S rRNA (adenine(2503)-C(2))-methyltransferase RlmN [Coriobacteriales bacterium]|nr:23S rRNA (adenine(2503)-C(2))-methyltransferase RlmN [Coriobacteriales bacterium]